MTVFNSINLMISQSAAGSSAWYSTDYTGDHTGAIRTFAGTLTVGDTITIEVALDDSRNITATQAFTTTPFNGTITGPITAVRVTKTGTTGVASVLGLL